MYEFKLYDITNNLVWFIPFKTITLTDELNVGVTGTLNIDYETIKRYASIFSLTPDGILSAGYREWKLYKDSNLLYGGILTHRKISTSGVNPTSFTVNFCDFFNALERRITGNAGTWEFDDDDSADIAWSLINQTQAISDMGITRGTHPTTINRDRKCVYDNIRDVIVKMSNKELYNGYDFDITAEKVFNIYYPNRGSVKINIILDEVNIISATSDRDLSGKIANSVTVLGQGTDIDLITSNVQDATSQTTWKLQEEILQSKDVIEISTLTDKGNKLLDNKKYPRDIVSISARDDNPEITSYNVGDTVKVIIKELDFNENLRILKRSLQITPTGQAQVDLSFDYE
jgi:hypothetical protein